MNLGLYIKTLGDLSIRYDSESITNFPSRKAEALLVYLAVEKDAPHRRESLFTLLWPEMPEKSARHNLRQVLYALGQIFPAVIACDGDETVPLLLSDRNTVQINPRAAGQVDVHLLDRHLQETQVHDHLSLGSCATCLQTLEKIVDLYAGDFLRDFYLEDSNAFEDWAAANREAYRSKVVNALETLTEIFIQKGDYDQARAFTDQQLKIDSLSEIAYRKLMELLSKSGQRAEALRVYQQCASKLEIELGTHPSRETTTLFEIIRGDDLRQSTTTLHEGAIRGYEIREHLGTGHAATVYRALQPVIGRDVAIKIILPQFANHPDFIRRFEVEAQLVARLEHPHIVPLYDYWRDPSGAYLVMRWLKGGNLQNALKLGPWKPTPAVQLVEQVGAALALAHHQGVVHCDIKPANILLDEEGHAYLTDFGIAILTGPLAQLNQHLHTNSISSPGSLGYSPPEATRGQLPTPLADIYSLGVVLFELLCGVHPFHGIEGEALVQKHLNEPLPSVLAFRPELPEAVDAVIQRATAKEPSTRYLDVETLAREFRLALIPDSAPLPEIAEIKIVSRNPYKGLRPFAEADAADFFGREDLVKRLLERLSPVGQIAEPARFLAVVGPSGSGKSSVVKAGLIPAVRRGAIPSSEGWFIAEMTPGTHPLEELETALLRIAIATPDDLLNQLSTDTRGLVRLLRRALPGVKSEILLIIDQFEELFTLVTDENERNYFLELLSAAVSDPHSPLRLLITLRADFYDRPLQRTEFGELVRQTTEVVLPLTPAELERAICAPAEGVGTSLEPILVARILQEVGDQPGALPLLQYALTECFDHRDGNQLTLLAYETSGGMLGALGRRAEEIYSRLTPDQQSATRQMFLRLVTLGEGIEDTRRRVLRGEIESTAGQEPTVLVPVIEQYGRHRLLTFDHDPATRAPTVEVAHESLLREWPRLRTWLDESRSDIRMQRLLSTATQEWLAANQDPGYLLRGARLDQFSIWFDDTNIALTTDEQAYLAASLEARKERQEAEAARQVHEIQLEQRSRRFLRALVGVFAGAAVVALLLSGVAFNQSNIAQENAFTATFAQGEALLLADARATQQAIAEEQANARATQQAIAEEQAQQRAIAEEIAQDNLRLARANELGAVSINLVKKQPDLAFLLSVEAYHQANSLQNWTALYSVGTYHPQLRRVLRGHLGRVTSVDYSPDGKRLASSGVDGTVRIWDMDPASVTFGSYFELSANQEIPMIESVAFSPDGWLVAASTADGRQLAGSPPEINHVLLWDVNPTSENYKKILIDKVVAETVWGRSMVAFSPSDPILAVARNGRIEIMDVDLNSATFGQEIGAVISSNGDEGYFSVAFSPDGEILSAGHCWPRTGDVFLWRLNPENPSLSQEVADLNLDPLYICGLSLTFSPDGKRLIMGNDAELNIMIWDVDPDSSTFGDPLVFMPGHEWYVADISLSADGNRLATVGGRDPTARIWDIDPDSDSFGQQIGKSILHGSSVETLAFSPDDTTLTVGVGDGSLYLWDMTIQFMPSVDPGAWFLAMFTAAEASEFQLPHPLETILLGHTGLIESLAFSPDGKILASGGGSTEGGGMEQAAETIDGSIRLWDVDPSSSTYGQQIGDPLGRETSQVFGMAYHPDGNWLASSNYDGNVQLWDVVLDSPTFGMVVAELRYERDEEEPKLSAGEVAFSPDGRMLAANYGSDDASACILWDVDPTSNTFGQPLMKIDAYAGDGLAFSPDGKLLGTAAVAGITSLTTTYAPIQVWDVDPESAHFGQLVLEINKGHGAGVNRLRFHPNGKIMASASSDDTIRLWDVDPNSPTFGQAIGGPLVAEGQEIFGMALSPDGKILASSTVEGGKLQLWDVDLNSPTFGQPLGVPLNQEDILAITLEFSPDGKHFAVGDVYHRIHLWNVDPAAWVDFVCSRTGRNLSEDEWNRYLAWVGPYDPHYKTCPQWP